MVFTMPYETQVDVRFRDTDCLGHINNVVYLSYCETCRLRYFEDKLGYSLDGTGQVPIIMAHASIDFLAQGFFTQSLTVSAQTIKVGTKSFTQEYEVKSGSNILAKSQAVLVWFDFAQQTSVAIPDKFRAILEEA